jgi:hypothetical protein
MDAVLLSVLLLAAMTCRSPSVVAANHVSPKPAFDALHVKRLLRGRSPLHHEQRL